MSSHHRDPVEVALVGYGFAGKTFHAPVISAVKGLKLSHIVSSDPAKVHRDWPNVMVTSRIDEACSNPSIGLIVIATPNTSHFELAQKSLSAGKHVVVDKPFTLTVAEASKLLAHAAAAKRLISVFQSRRWDGDFLTLRPLLHNGPLGEITHFESHYDRYRPEVKPRWREMPGPGSGIWFDLGPHLIDQVLQLFGLPEAIFADLAAQRRGGSTVDYFHVLMRYGARRVIVHGESFASADLPRFIVHGTLGSFVIKGRSTASTAALASWEPPCAIKPGTTMAAPAGVVAPPSGLGRGPAEKPASCEPGGLGISGVSIGARPTMAKVDCEDGVTTTVVPSVASAGSAAATGFALFSGGALKPRGIRGMAAGGAATATTGAAGSALSAGSDLRGTGGMNGSGRGRGAARLSARSFGETALRIGGAAGSGRSSGGRSRSGGGAKGRTGLRGAAASRLGSLRGWASAIFGAGTRISCGGRGSSICPVTICCRKIRCARGGLGSATSDGLTSGSFLRKLYQMMCGS